MKNPWLMAAAGVLLAACGGGGGGGSERLKLSHHELSFGSPSQGPAAFGTVVTGSVSNLEHNIFMGVDSTSLGIYVNGPYFEETDAGLLDVVPKDPVVLGPGRYEDVVVVVACKDSFCNRHIAGSPATITVTHVVGLAPTPRSLVFSAVETVVPTPQPLALEHYAGATPWTSETAYAEGASWLELSAVSGTLPTTVQAAPTALSAGIYHATLTLTGGAETTQVPVTYTVTPLLVTSAPAAFTVTNASPASAYTQTLVVSSADPGRVISWSAHSDAAWLQVTPDGDTDAQSQLTLTIVDESFLALHNGDYGATVTLTSTSPGASPITVDVQLHKDISQVHYIAPYVGFSGQAGEFIVRGEHFDQRMPETLKLGATEAAFAYVSPTELRVSVPALAAGRYAVDLLSDGGTVGSSAELVVVDAPRFAPTAINPACPAFHFYDAERSTLYLDSNAEGYAPYCRYRRSGDQWVLEPIPVANIRDVRLSPDGRQLIVLEPEAVSHLDPDTLELIARKPWPHTEYNPYTFSKLHMTNDGRAVISAAGRLYYYDLDRRTYDIQSYPAQLIRGATSADGSRVILGGGDEHYTFNPVWAYDAATGAAANTGMDLHMYWAWVDRDGGRALMRGGRSNNGLSGWSISDSANAVLGKLPVDSVATGDSSYWYVLSVDGQRAYQTLGDVSWGQIRIVDLDVADETGYFTPRAESFSPMATDDSSYPMPPRPIAETPDGGALFMLGDKNFWTEPLPGP